MDLLFIQSVFNLSSEICSQIEADWSAVTSLDAANPFSCDCLLRGLDGERSANGGIHSDRPYDEVHSVYL